MELQPPTARLPIVNKRPGRVPLVPLTAEQKELVEQYVPLAGKLAESFARRMPRWASRDEVKSDATLGLMRAVQQFNPGLGMSFQTYASRRIVNTIIDGVRDRSITPRSAQARQVKRVADRAEELIATGLAAPQADERARAELAAPKFESLAKLLIEGDSRDASLCDSLEDPCPRPHEAIERREGLDALARHLPEPQRRVIRRHYGDGATLKAIAAEFGFTESRACQLHLAALRSLRWRFGVVNTRTNQP